MFGEIFSWWLTYADIKYSTASETTCCISSTLLYAALTAADPMAAGLTMTSIIATLSPTR
jgi:hypothetical protein